MLNNNCNCIFQTISSAPQKPEKNVVAIDSAESFVNEATLVEIAKETPKSTSAKSRDSGIEEMVRIIIRTNTIHYVFKFEWYIVYLFSKNRFIR